MAFNIDNYVDVPTRLAEAMKRWPNLRIQETNAEVVTMPDGSTFYRCTVTVWRDETDPIPSIATAAEPYPGKTPYTKNSEFMVGMTSALGRALGYMGCGANKSIASRNEVMARQDSPGITEHPSQPYTGALATAKQLGYIKRLALAKEWDDNETIEQLHKVLGVNDVTIDHMTASQASKVIEAWK